MAVIDSFDSGNSTSSNIDYLFNKKGKETTLKDVYDAVAGTTDTLYERTVKIDEKLDSILMGITMSNNHLETISSALLLSGGGDFGEASKNTIELSVNGNAKDFMESLTKLAELDDINLISVANGLDNISQSLDKILNKNYSKSEAMLTSLESMSIGLTKFASSLPSFKMLGGIAGGIALIGLSIGAFIGAIQFSDVLMLGAIFGGIALASRLLKDTQYNLFKASLGIATLGLSLWAFDKVVDTAMLLNFAGTLTAFGLSVAIFDKLFGASTARVATQLSGLSLGLGALGLSLLPFNLVEWESVAKATASLSAIGGASYLLKKIELDDIAKVGGLGLAVGGIGLGMLPFKALSLMDVGVGLTALGGVAGLGFLISKLTQKTLIGVGSLIAMGGAMGAVAWGLDEIRKLDLSLKDAGVIAGTLAITVGAFALLGVPTVAALVGIGALTALAMGAGLATLAYGLNHVATVDINERQAKNFGNSVILIKDAISEIGMSGGLVSLVAGIAQSALIAGATLPLVLAVNMVSKVKTPTEGVIDGFGQTINELKNIFTSFGLLDLAKLAATTPVMLLMAGTTVALGGAINLFTKLSTSKGIAEGAVSTLDTFLVGIHSTFAKHDDNSFEVIQKGINATMGLGTLLKNLSTGISSISVHMEKNTDFNAIGTSVGAMLQALTAPLSAIGGEQDSISIGGFTVTNPFSNKVEKGIDALKNIGSVFTPLADILSVFANDKSGNLVTKFDTNIRGILGTLSSIFMEYKDSGENGGMEFLNKATDNSSRFIKTISESKYEHASKGLSSIAKSTITMQTAVNDMDLSKLSKLNDLFHNMNLLNEGDGMEALIDAMGKFAEAIMKQSKVTNEDNSKKVTINNEKSKDGKETVIEKKGEENPLAEIILQSNGDVVEVMEKLTDFLQSGALKATVKMEESF